MGKSMKPGGGGRFKKMVASGKSPALAAWIGNKTYGKTQMQEWAQAGRKKKKKKNALRSSEKRYGSR